MFFANFLAVYSKDIRIWTVYLNCVYEEESGCNACVGGGQLYEAYSRDSGGRLVSGRGWDL